MHKSLLFYLWSCVLLVGCAAEPAEQVESDDLLPDQILHIYQGHYDRNEFDQAKKYSTPAEQERLDELAQILAQEDTDSTILETTFISIDCSTSGDTAFCLCELQDQYEQYRANYQLLRIQDKWLVDAPHEEQLRIDEEMDKLMDSLLNSTQ